MKHVTRAEQLAIELGAPLGDRDGTRLVPMLCGRDETDERVLTDRGWLYELKLDGVRILADKRDGRVALGYRKLREATESYPEIAEAVAQLAERRVVLDGEIVAFDEKGRPSFQRLGRRIQARGTSARRAAQSVAVVYVVFDVLVVGDRDVTGLPIEARKAILERIVDESVEAGGRIRLHPVFSDGQELFRQCRTHELEGVVAKRAGSLYRSDDRSADWVKVKCELVADLVVLGWTAGEGKRSRLGALDVGAYDGTRLIARGSVGSGLDEDVIDELLERLRALEIPKAIAEGSLRPKRGRHFTKPEIVVSVRYVGISDEGLLRHPVFRGVRHDLAPEECTLQRDDSLRRYYGAVARLLVPYLRGRTCPVLAAAEPAKTRSAVVPDVDALLFLVDAGGGSLLMTPAREASAATADFVALAVRGSERGAAWAAALRVREVVSATGLAAFAKTDGAGGYDVLVPVGDAPVEAARALGALFVRLLSDDAAPLGATIERADAVIAPWAVAWPVARERGARASLPVAWEHHAEDDGASSLLDAVVERASGSAIDDPMRGMLTAKVDFARAVAALEAMVASRSFVPDPHAR